MDKFFSRLTSTPPRTWLFWIIAFSIFARVAVAIYMGDQVVDLPGTADQVSYHNLAIRVVNGYGFSFGENWWPATRANSPTAHWSFLYTFYLAAIYKVFGVHPLIARLVQAVVVGFLHPWLAYRLGKLTFNQVVGLFAAGITAVYIYFIYYSGTLMTEPFYITIIMAVALILISLVKANNSRLHWSNYLWLGVLLGLIVLLRQLFLLIIPFLFLWYFIAVHKAGAWKILKRLTLSIGVIILLILPFTIYNYTRFGRILLNTNSGYAFFWGNHPVYGTKFIGILPPELGTYEGLIPPELLSLDEAALDQALLKRGLQFVLDDPGRYILLSLSRIPVYFNFLPSSESGIISNISRVGSFGIFLPFMLYGLILAGARGYFRKLTDPAWLFFIFMLAYTGLHLLTWALVRYRLPVDAFFILFAALALHHLSEKLINRHNRTVELDKPL